MTLQRLRENLLLFEDLDSVIEVLVMASATLAESKVFAFRRHSLRSSLDQFRRCASQESCVDALRFDRDQVSRNNVGHESHLPIHPGQAVASVHEFLDPDSFGFTCRYGLEFSSHPLRLRFTQTNESTCPVGSPAQWQSTHR